jgi:hypothetical protein
LNHRFGPRTSIDQARANVEALVAGEADVTFTDLSPSAPPSRENPLVVALAESGVLSIEPKQAWTDVARFHAAGVPAANFGPGTQAQAHQRNEWTHLPGLATGQAILARFFAKIAGVAGVALALLAATATTGCEQASGGTERRSDAVTNATPASPSQFERAEVKRWLAALTSRVGRARVLVVDVQEKRVVAQVEDGAHPGQVLEFILEGEHDSAPERAELRGSGDLGTNLFTLRDAALDKIPDLVKRAVSEVDAQNGRVTRIVLRRQLPQTDALRFRVYVESPRLSGHIDFDASGTPVSDGPS